MIDFVDEPSSLSRRKQGSKPLRGATFFGSYYYFHNSSPISDAPLLVTLDHVILRERERSSQRKHLQMFSAVELDVLKERGTYWNMPLGRSLGALRSGPRLAPKRSSENNLQLAIERNEFVLITAASSGVGITAIETIRAEGGRKSSGHP
jgi:hypothetical protein